MCQAIQEELNGLMKRGCFQDVKKNRIPRLANVIICKYILAIKLDENDFQKYQERFVLGGQGDRHKAFLVHTSQTIQPSSTRLLLALSDMNDFKLWSEDALQAYTQADDPLERLVFIDHVPLEFCLQEDECLQVLKLVYGLSDFGDYWHKTIDEHLRDELQMQPLAFDPALYVEKTSDTLTGLSGLYVDDLLRTGNMEFHQKCKATRKNSTLRSRTNRLLSLLDSILRSREGSLVLSQNRYVRKLEELPQDADYALFCSVRMKLGLLLNTRPDVLFEISTFAQATQERFNKDKRECIERLNRAIRYAVKNRIELKIPQLNTDSVRVVGYPDSSFANNYDLSTQLGYIIFLVDQQGSCVPLVFKSYKSRRIKRSALAGEVIAFADMSDAAVTINKEVSILLNLQVALQLFTDSKSLFDIISKGSRTSEKRLMLDIAAAREKFRTMDVPDICMVRSADNIADGLKKSMHYAALRVMQSGKIMVKPVQTILRTKRKQ